MHGLFLVKDRNTLLLSACAAELLAENEQSTSSIHCLGKYPACTWAKLTIAYRKLATVYVFFIPKFGQVVFNCLHILSAWPVT